MRIIIELDKDGLPVQVQTEAESDQTRESDGGAPQYMLAGNQESAAESEPSTSAASQAKSAGGPPDWLVQAIESAVAAEAPGQDEPVFKDGGAAPA